MSALHAYAGSTHMHGSPVPPCAATMRLSCTPGAYVNCTPRSRHFSCQHAHRAAPTLKKAARRLLRPLKDSSGRSKAPPTAQRLPRKHRGHLLAHPKALPTTHADSRPLEGCPTNTASISSRTPSPEQPKRSPQRTRTLGRSKAPPAARRLLRPLEGSSGRSKAAPQTSRTSPRASTVAHA
ncbi:hypothetical protein C2E23DRAFT_887227 [Lenzites betulinus]|nr:hypothetical protein C2E23DRAFT_887227 [Lenzites betulinus]